ncbi:MAG: formate dehydrogenase [Ottowia sp.]
MHKPTPSREKRQPALSRRTIFAGAGAAGAAATVAAILPGVIQKSTPAPSAPLAATDGYQLTEHVQRYYRTAKV